MKKKNDKIHYKKIHIKHVKKEDSDSRDINMHNNIQIKNDINYPKEKQNKILVNPQINIVNNNQTKHKNKNKHNIGYEEKDINDEFNLDDINNQLDEILENIDLDGIDEINKKIKYLGEDKNMLNTISYNDDKYNSVYKKIDNKNKKQFERNKIYTNTEGVNNYAKHINNDYKNISNNRYLFTSMNNTYRHWKDENNCNDDEEDDNYLNKTNISLFYKYNKFNNYNKSNNYYE